MARRCARERVVMIRRLTLVLVVLAVASVRSAEAGKVLVAANGTDGPACGVGKVAPCRTIGQAIVNARTGDIVEVGPGRYGDVDGDGAFDGPGDEPAAIDVGCDCVVHVPAGKPLVIVSRLGSGTTLIDAGGADANVVRIDAAGTTFGKLKHGFTLTRAGDGRGLDSAANDLAIGGNLALNNASHGMRISGDRAAIVGNTASANGASGFQLDGARDGVVRGNVALFNGDDGFNQVNRSLVLGNVSIGNDNDGFDQQDDGVVYRTNTALGNGAFGFDLNEGDGSVMIGVLAQGNGNGINVDGSDVLIVKSSIVGNRGVGIVIEDEGQGLVVSKTNVFGNDVAGDLMLTNCGVSSLSGGPLNVATVFWGAPNGPGDDPADELCLLVPHGGLVVEPPLAKEIKVKPPR